MLVAIWILLTSWQVTGLPVNQIVYVIFTILAMASSICKVTITRR